MAISVACPKCQIVIEGTLEDLRRHYGACNGKAPRSKSKRGKTPVVAEPQRSGKPELTLAVFFIPNEVTSSLNGMLQAHVGQAFADKTRWREAVSPLLLGYEPARNRRRRLEIFRSAKSELDTDNLYGSVKYLVDAIKDTGALVDDKPKWTDLIVTQGWSPREGKGMLVRITDLGESDADQEHQAAQVKEGLPPAPPAGQDGGVQ